jgi:uncharacterized damage-inducible protein DinB
MTTSAELLGDAFGRIRELVEQTVDALDLDQLSWRVADDANTIAWLVWHLTRVQDSSITSASGGEQAWNADGWSERFALPFDDRATGYGQSTVEVGAVRVSAELLLGYHDAVSARTLAYVSSLDDTGLDRVVDTRFDPPVTLAVRLVSIVSDELQHAGQAAFVRGVVLRRR